MQNRTSIFDIDDFSLGKKLGMLGKLYHSALTKKLRHIGIERYFSLLVLLDNLGPKCSQKHIAEALHTDKATMVGIIDSLTYSGFIKRTRNPNDRREYWVQLTNKAKKHINEIKRTIHEMNTMLLKGIKPDDTIIINKYLEIMYENVWKEITNNL